MSLVLYFKYGTDIKSSTGEDRGLAANTNGEELIQDLVNKDTDGDGVLDWEEGLWGTDPKNKDTMGNTLGDKAEIEKIKKEQDITDGSTTENENNLSETDKFARELFATVNTLNQNGQMDQATVDKITSSLADRLQNSAPRKTFNLREIKLGKEDTKEATLAYNEALNSLYKKYPINGDVLTILSKLAEDEAVVDQATLNQLDPIIKQTSLFVGGLTKINVPPFLSTKHLNFLNILEKLLENMTDIKLFNSDVIVALSGMSQYEQNSTDLDAAVKDLMDAMTEKLNN